MKTNVKDKIEAGVYKLCKPNANSENLIWRFFARIQKDDESLVEGFVSCIKCTKIIKCPGMKTGNLYRHKCYVLTKGQNEAQSVNNVNDNEVEVTKKRKVDTATDDASIRRVNNRRNSKRRACKSQRTNLKGKLVNSCRGNDKENSRYLAAIEKQITLVQTEDEDNSIDHITESDSEDSSCTIEENYFVDLEQTTATEEELPKDVSAAPNVPNKPSILNIKEIYCRKEGDNNNVLPKMVKRDLVLTNPTKTTLIQEDIIALRNETKLIFSKLILEDRLPITTLKGQGFQEVLCYCTMLGAKYGNNLNIKNIIPDTTTMSLYLEEMFKAKKSKIINEILENSKTAAITIDFLTDVVVKKQFLIITLNFAKHFQLYEFVVAVKALDFVQTEKTIGITVEEVLKDFLLDDLKKLVFVTKSSAEVSFEGYNVLHCSQHLFASVLNKALEDTKVFNEINLICKFILKRLRSKNQLIVEPNPTTTTQCNDQYIALQTLNLNWSKIQEILHNFKISEASFNCLKTLMELCQKFEIIFEKLQETQKPSICFVLPSIHRLKDLCVNTGNDTAKIRALKANILQNLENIWEPKINIWHKVAFFLYPPANQEQIEDLKAIKEFCLEEMKLMNPTQNTNDPVVPCTPSKSVNNTGHQRKELHFFFPTLCQVSTTTSTNTNNDAEEEIKRYCREIIVMDDNFDVCQWWLHNSINYPLLSKLAAKILAIPASAKGSQRFLPFLRENLDAESSKIIENILFLNSVLKNGV